METELLLNQFERLRVAVIGDIMLDHYIWGDAERISPEAPVPVIDVNKDTYIPGGAANVALNISSLGGKAILCGSIANDDAGAQLAMQLNTAGVDFDTRFARNEAPTIVKTRIVVRNQQLCRLDREEHPTAYSLENDKESILLEQKLKNIDAVIFSDYGKGIVTEKLISKIQRLTQGQNVLLAMDPKPRRSLKFQGLDLMTPNRLESLALSKIEKDPHHPFPFEEICQALWAQYQTKQLVITLGDQGMLLSERGMLNKLIPTIAQEVFDVSGAGDTVIASLTLALCSGATLEEATRFSNFAAGVVVGKIGTATVTAEELLKYQEKIQSEISVFQAVI